MISFRVPVPLGCVGERLLIEKCAERARRNDLFESTGQHLGAEGEQVEG